MVQTNKNGIIDYNYPAIHVAGMDLNITMLNFPPYSLILPSFNLRKKVLLMPLISPIILEKTNAISRPFLSYRKLFISLFHFTILNYFFYKKSLPLILLFFVTSSTAQTTAPYAVNIAGNHASVGNFNLEWSVGESAAITTIGNSNLIVTNGLLQYNVENQSESNKIGIFLPNEIKVYPSPVKNILDINIVHANKGKHLIELFDAKGVKIKEVQLIYNGLGALESWNLSSLAAGQYILNIRQMHPANGKQVKNGVFKILKVN